jgi:hypothetical protein
MEVRAEQSIRTLLSGSDSLSVQEYFQECPHVKNLYIASLADTDDCAGYRKIRSDTVVRFINLIDKYFQVALFDCDESTEDPLSMYGLTLSAKIIYITRPAIQSVVFAKAYEQIVSGLQIAGRLDVVLICTGSAGDDSMYIPFGVKNKYRVLPFCKEIASERGSPTPLVLAKGAGGASKAYRRGISILADSLVSETSRPEAFHE